MNWKLILLLSLFGVISGVASLFGIDLSDPLILLIVFLAGAWIIAARAASSYFLHGFSVGVLSQIWLSLFEAYYVFDMSRHGLAESLPRGVHPQVWYLLWGLVSALVKGLILGLFALVGARMIDKRKTTVAG